MLDRHFRISDCWIEQDRLYHLDIVNTIVRQAVPFRDMPHTHGHVQRGKCCLGQKSWNARGRMDIIGGLFAGTPSAVAVTVSNVNAADIFNM